MTSGMGIFQSIGDHFCVALLLGGLSMGGDKMAGGSRSLKLCFAEWDFQRNIWPCY